MDIKYFGHSSFQIRTKNAKIATDPFDPEYIGLPFAKVEADILTISHEHRDHNFKGGIKGEPLVLDWPGEFEKNGVRINGFDSFHDAVGGTERGSNVMYKFEADGFSVLHLGDLGHLLDEAMIEMIGEVDVLLIPVGGKYTINLTNVVKTINKIEPRIVIPMHYGNPELKQDIFGELAVLPVFLKEIGASDIIPIDMLTLKQEDATDNVQVVILNI